MKTNIRKFKVNKEQLAIIIMIVETKSTKFYGSMKFRKLHKLTKETLFTKIETILKSHKKYTRVLKIAFNIAQCKLPDRV